MGGGKTLFLFLGLLALVGLMYWGSMRISKTETPNPSLASAVNSGKEKLASLPVGQVLGVDALKNVFGNLAINSEQAVKNGAVNLIQAAANVAKNQISSSLQPASGPDATSVIQVPGQNAGGVCPSYGVGGVVSYIIKFSPVPSTQIYSVDWGDSHTSEGSVGASSTYVSASHEYQKSGDYTLTFKLPGGSSQIQKEICVN